MGNQGAQAAARPFAQLPRPAPADQRAEQRSDGRLHERDIGGPARRPAHHQHDRRAVPHVRQHGRRGAAQRVPCQAGARRGSRQWKPSSQFLNQLFRLSHTVYIVTSACCFVLHVVLHAVIKQKTTTAKPTTTATTTAKPMHGEDESPGEPRAEALISPQRLRKWLKQIEIAVRCVACSR